MTKVMSINCHRCLWVWVKYRHRSDMAAILMHSCHSTSCKSWITVFQNMRLKATKIIHRPAIEQHVAFKAVYTNPLWLKWMWIWRQEQLKLSLLFKDLVQLAHMSLLSEFHLVQYQNWDFMFNPSQISCKKFSVVFRSQDLVD